MNLFILLFGPIVIFALLLLIAVIAEENDGAMDCQGTRQCCLISLIPFVGWLFVIVAAVVLAMGLVERFRK